MPLSQCNKPCIQTCSWQHACAHICWAGDCSVGSSISSLSSLLPPLLAIFQIFACLLLFARGLGGTFPLFGKRPSFLPTQPDCTHTQTSSRQLKTDLSFHFHGTFLTASPAWPHLSHHHPHLSSSLTLTLGWPHSKVQSISSSVYVPPYHSTPLYVLFSCSKNSIYKLYFSFSLAFETSQREKLGPDFLSFLQTDTFEREGGHDMAGCGLE